MPTDAKDIVPRPAEVTLEQLALAGRESMLLPERVLRLVLLDAVQRVIADPAIAERYFKHFFDPSVTEAERNDFITDFTVNKPPKVKQGYPRSHAEFPGFYITLESEQESELFIGGVAGQSPLGSDDPSTFQGSFWDAVYNINVFSQHIDRTNYLYQFAKSVFVGARQLLMSCGFNQVGTMTGAELMPAPEYAGENVWIRVLRIPVTIQTTVPLSLPANPNKARIHGPYMDDVVVDGIQGGVHPIILGGDDD